MPEGTAVTPGTLAVHTGSIAAVLEPGASAVYALVKAARATATITYDPNIRPALTGDPVDARRSIERLVALADVVKVSDDDLAWLVPGVDPVEVARDWLARGPAIVVVTLGGDGAVAATSAGSSEWRLPGHRSSTPWGRATRSWGRCSTGSGAQDCSAQGVGSRYG